MAKYFWPIGDRINGVPFSLLHKGTPIIVTAGLLT